MWLRCLLCLLKLHLRVCLISEFSMYVEVRSVTPFREIYGFAKVRVIICVDRYSLTVSEAGTSRIGSQAV